MVQRHTELATFLGISHQSEEGMLLGLLIELGAQFVGAEEGSLLVRDEEANELVFARVVGPETSQEALLGQRVPLGKGIVGLAAQTGEVQIGAPTFPTRQAEQCQTIEGSPKAVLAAPMMADDHLVGVITAVSFDPAKRFSSADAMLYGRIAAVAGVVVSMHRKLAMIEAMQQEAAAPELTEEERLERDIAEAVGRLTRQTADHKKVVLGLLSNIEALLTR